MQKYNSFRMAKNRDMKENLKDYRAKRDFSKTPEPKGKKKKGHRELRYSLQYHEARKNHFDLRLEWDGVLLSWAIPKGPSFCSKDKRLAIRTENHPLDYWNFEGVIPKGQYGGGTVLLFDQGTWISKTNVKEGLEKGVLKFTLYGKRYQGDFTLIRFKNEENWLLIKEIDSYARKSSGMARKKTSILTGKTSKEIGNGGENPFSKPDVELALLKEKVPTGKQWIYEIKYDGYRMIGEKNPDKTRLFSRNYKDYSAKFPHICQELEKNPHSVILDGEMICVDETGKSSFQKLLSSIRHKNTESAVYMVFDLLAFDGVDYRTFPLKERRKKLKDYLRELSSDVVLYSKEIKGDGEQIFENAQELSLEGIVAKDITSPYLGKRSGNWVKIKCRQSDEFVVLGYETSSVKNLKNVLLGKKEKKRYVYQGKVGTGWSSSLGLQLLQMFQKKETNVMYFDGFKKSKEVHLVEPFYVCEIDFLEYTESGKIRQGSWKGIREDKKVSEVKEKKGFVLTSPDKIIYPERKITKGDVAAYYQKVSAKMMPFLSHRPLAVIRCNNGIEHSFFKKHPDTKKEGIQTFHTDQKEYFYVDEKMGILSEVQSGTVEFHIWGCQKETLMKPDYMVFDLDPEEGLGLEKVRKAARDLKKILEDLGLTSFLKTSGGKGYHIVVPIQGFPSWEAFSSFAKQIAELMESRYPDLYTASMSKKKRKNKVFIDWMRNKKGATSVAPYSLRARKNATVSMPISWKELDEIAPDGIDIFSAPKRLRKNPWAKFEQIKKKQTWK